MDGIVEPAAKFLEKLLLAHYGTFERLNKNFLRNASGVAVIEGVPPFQYRSPMSDDSHISCGVQY